MSSNVIALPNSFSKAQPKYNFPATRGSNQNGDVFDLMYADTDRTSNFSAILNTSESTQVVESQTESVISLNSEYGNMEAHTSKLYEELFDIVYNLNLYKSFDTIDQISKLKKNWNGYKAKRIPKRVIKIAQSIVRKLLKQPDILPTPRQSIWMQYEKEDLSFLGIEILKDRIELMYIEKENYDKAEKCTLYETDYRVINSWIEKLYG